MSLYLCAISILVLNESACATGLYDLSKSTILILELPFSQWLATNSHTSEHSPSLMIGAMSEQGYFVTSGMDLIGMESKIRLKCFLVILHK